MFINKIYRGIYLLDFIVLIKKKTQNWLTITFLFSTGQLRVSTKIILLNKFCKIRNILIIFLYSCLKIESANQMRR